MNTKQFSRRVPFGMALVVATLMFAGGGCSSADDTQDEAQNDDDGQSDADFAETASQDEALTGSTICNGICTGSFSLACAPFGYVGSLACGLGSWQLCSKGCSKHKAYHPSKGVAEACLRKLHIGSPDCYSSTRFVQHCSGHIGGESGGAGVSYVAAGPNAGKIQVSWKIGSHFRPVSIAYACSH